MFMRYIILIAFILLSAGSNAYGYGFNPIDFGVRSIAMGGHCRQTGTVCGVTQLSGNQYGPLWNVIVHRVLLSTRYSRDNVLRNTIRAVVSSW